MPDVPLVRLDRTGYRLEFEDDFDGQPLDRTRWLPHYLPQWSSRAASAARYEVVDSILRLRIDRDQQPWCPEWDGELRVSSLQTGVLAGPLGSPIGQHRFAPGVLVREAQEPLALYTPQDGLIECRASAVADPANMVALWMIGYEDRPEHSGELCIFEIFGRDVAPGSVIVGMGLHPFGDPSISDDFERVALNVDASEFHNYAADWTPERIRFFVDDELVREVAQAPAYPMQLILSLYEFAAGPALASAADTYPKEFLVDWVRGWRRDPRLDQPGSNSIVGSGAG
jgi:Glycosyl hydrolases family 16